MLSTAEDEIREDDPGAEKHGWEEAATRHSDPRRTQMQRLEHGSFRPVPIMGEILSNIDSGTFKRPRLFNRHMDRMLEQNCYDVCSRLMKACVQPYYMHYVGKTDLALKAVDIVSDTLEGCQLKYKHCMREFLVPFKATLLQTCGKGEDAKALLVGLIQKTQLEQPTPFTHVRFRSLATTLIHEPLQRGLHPTRTDLNTADNLYSMVGNISSQLSQGRYLVEEVVKLRMENGFLMLKCCPSGRHWTMGNQMQYVSFITKWDDITAILKSTKTKIDNQEIVKHDAILYYLLLSCDYNLRKAQIEEDGSKRRRRVQEAKNYGELAKSYVTNSTHIKKWRGFPAYPGRRLDFLRSAGFIRDLPDGGVSFPDPERDTNSVGFPHSWNSSENLIHTLSVSDETDANETEVHKDLEDSRAEDVCSVDSTGWYMQTTATTLPDLSHSNMHAMCPFNTGQHLVEQRLQNQNICSRQSDRQVNPEQALEHPPHNTRMDVQDDDSLISALQQSAHQSRSTDSSGFEFPTSVPFDTDCNSTLGSFTLRKHNTNPCLLFNPVVDDSSSESLPKGDMMPDANHHGGELSEELHVAAFGDSYQGAFLQDLPSRISTATDPDVSSRNHETHPIYRHANITSTIPIFDNYNLFRSGTEYLSTDLGAVSSVSLENEESHNSEPKNLFKYVFHQQNESVDYNRAITLLQDRDHGDANSDHDETGDISSRAYCQSVISLTPFSSLGVSDEGSDAERYGHINKDCLPERLKSEHLVGDEEITDQVSCSYDENINSCITGLHLENNGPVGDHISLENDTKTYFLGPQMNRESDVRVGKCNIDFSASQSHGSAEKCGIAETQDMSVLGVTSIPIKSQLLYEENGVLGNNVETKMTKKIVSTFNIERTPVDNTQFETEVQTQRYTCDSHTSINAESGIESDQTEVKKKMDTENRSAI